MTRIQTMGLINTFTSASGLCCGLPEMNDSAILSNLNHNVFLWVPLTVRGGDGLRLQIRFDTGL